MKRLGLTGGIGMGKSAVASMLELQSRKIPVVDTDVLARELVEPGMPALAEIKQAFGPGVLAADGTLRRDELARLVFKDESARARLESILHPRIRSLWQELMETWRNARHPLAVVVIPLLFETSAEADLDETICVACSGATQRSRLRSRGWSDEEIEHRIRAQLPIEAKMEKADYVIWNESSFETLGAQLDLILRRLST